MTVARLAHYSIRARDLERSRRFYTDILGLREGYRPPFEFPGIWLYADGSDADFGSVHLIGAGAGLEAYLGSRAASPGTGALDHVAFSARDWPSLHARLDACGISYEEREVPSLNLHQVFLSDPDGVVIELNYPSGENLASAG